MASNRDMMYCEKTPGRRLRPAVKESCDRSLSPCHLRAMILTALLTMFSMGMAAKVTVETGKFTGGTVVEKSQTENAADGTVTVTLTVTPAKGYAISKKDITVVATIAPSSSRGSSRRNAPEIGDALELKGDDPKDLSQPRDYTVTVDANLGVWVKEAKFKESGAKADENSDDLSGVYYIAGNGDAYEAGTNTVLPYTYDSDFPATNFYLRPAADPQINDKSDAFFDKTAQTKPFLTTNYTDHTDIALWFLKKEDNYYTIQHVETGKYVVCDPYFTNNNWTLGGNNNTRRKTMHLETKDWTTTVPDKALFKIGVVDVDCPTCNSDGSYYFVPKRVESATFKYMNIADRNQPVNYGTNRSGTSNYYGGLVGLYSTVSSGKIDVNSWFNFEPYEVAQPTITFNNATNQVTITATEGSLYYTTNGDTPTSALTPHTSPVTFTQTTPCTIKAIAVKSWDSGLEISSEENTLDLQKLATPTFSLNTSTNVLSITSTEGASIYYSIGTENTPAVGVNPYTSPFEFPYAQSSQPLKAIATKDGWINSDLGQQTITLSCPMPAISFNSNTQLVTLTCADAEATMYYTTNGDTPNPGQSGTTEYTGTPFGLLSSGTVKAIAIHTPNYNTSDMAEVSFAQVATPTIQNNGINAISITCATEGATIYYTTDGSTPTTESTLYTTPLTENVSNVTIKAIAVMENMIPSAVGSGTVKLHCATPVITRDGMTFSISCSMPTDATFYYSLDGSTPVTQYSGPVSFTTVQLPMTVTAVAKHANYTDSETATFELLNGTGTSSDPYLIYGATDFANFIRNVNNETTSSACYKLETDISASDASAITTAFTGSFDGGFHIISGLSHALFNSVNGGTVKNVILDNVGISSGTNVGAICNEATGETRIYNCGILSGSVGGSDYVGGLVGLLDGTARVINCYSYATITSGSNVGGIVGYNNGTTTAASINTMVMNCMFYGDITGGNTVSPVYGGNNIENLQGGLNTYNYYSYENLKTKKLTKDKYNCALAVEEKYLNRFEFYRLLLNSNKKLAAIYASKEGATVNPNDMAKWVLETADRQIQNPMPYPILKEQGYYPSIINIDAENAPDSASVGRNMGGKLGKKLEVNINIGSGYPEGAGIKSGKSQIFLERTDKDEARFNFNYDKVQLPYYNDVGTKNYTGNKVVTGWKITAITEVANDPYNDSNYPTSGIKDYPDHNYADRKSSNKDLYSVSKRVFSQGAYFDVPYGVKSITIEPYWAQACYVADANYDVVYKNDYTGKQNVSQTGTQVGSGATFNGDANQVIKTSVSAALGTIESPGSRVYDNAVVLVGNLHLDGVPSTGTTPFTMMSVDEDNDHEPDHSLIYHHKGRLLMSPIRFDFLDVIGTAQAQKPNGASLICNMTICRTRGWFEITNTSLMYFSQFEYENLGKDSNGNDNNGKVDAPLILHGGIFDQFVSTQNSSVNGKVIYIHVGGNVWMHEFSMGTHSDGKQSTPHVPVSVTGGDFDSFYLTGTYNANADVRDDNAECYISGGRFGELAGGGQEQIGNTGSANNGNVRWQIYDADITDFFGGGVNDAKPVQGNITTDIYNSHVTQFCGGPKFGNMATGKKVTTNAEGCVFGKYFGAGYGGNSYSRKKYYDKSGNPNWTTLENYYTGDKGKYYDGLKTQASQQGGDTDYGFKGPGIATDFDYEFFVWSSGTTGARLFVKFVSFSLAQCNDVESTLKSCKILENFYGGGSLGKVSGKATSTLEDCEVTGNVFGAGYSATLDSIPVRTEGFKTKPNYNSSSGMFEPGTYSGTDKFTWKQVASYPDEGVAGFDGTQVITTQDISHTNLGSVGTAILTIKGNTTVGGSVYGGGEESVVGADTEVIVTSGTIGAEGQGGAEYGNVYGGGKGKDDDVLAGLVKGNTKVTISGSPTIYHNVYGGGAYGSVGTFTYNATTGLPDTWDYADDKGKCIVSILGGTIGSTGKENGMVFGSSRGDVGEPGGITDKQAWVYKTEVVIGAANSETNATPHIKGSVYGGGENGHVFNDASVTVHSGTVGIDAANDPDGGARYPYRGNVYGAGCGTDTYGVDHDNDASTPDKIYFNRLAGIVEGNTTVTIDGGHVVHNVYGGGAMGSVGVFTREASNDIHMPGKITGLTSGGKCNVTVSGGVVGNAGATMKATGGPDDYGHVFGAGRGEVHDLADYPNLERVVYVDSTEVTISSNAFVTGSVYGGSESGHVLHNTCVTVSGGQIGCGEGATGAYTTWDSSVQPTAHWDYSGDHNPYDQYAGETGYNSEGAAATATDGHTFFGNVFGGGSGYYPYAPGKWLRSAGYVGGTATVTISGGHILNNVYGGCEMADIEGAVTVTMTGGTVGVPRSKAQIEALPTLGHIYGAGMGDKRIFFNTVTNVASTSVNVSGGTVYGSVYGGGEDGHVIGNAETTIKKETGEGKVAPVIGCDGTSGIDGNVFGGGQGSSTALTAGVVGGNVILNIQDGSINGSVYGGGRIASVGTFFAMATDQNYGKMQDGDDHGCIAVNLTGGTVEKNVYGGCMGTTVNPALGVSKNVTVELNKDVDDDAQGCAVKGMIFGCNNVNSSPEGTVTVHVYKTQRAGQTRITNTESVTTAKVEGTQTNGEFDLSSFDVQAVYGGGNLAAYVPKDLENGTTRVIIDGCDRTSIGQVYGGGNAASTPATDVLVNGTYEIGELFGGGNGKDAIDENTPNPGANVGFKDYHGVENDERWDTKEERQSNQAFIDTYTYGTGKANVYIKGGKIHRVFGGSNTKGNVRITALTMLEEFTENNEPVCRFQVDEAYGGGKSAPMDAEAKLLMACIPGLEEVYGGAQAADVYDDVTLTITNGTFNRVFGGNNISGTIRGKITVNIEETGCKPIIIGELYGGGNLAGYSVYGYNNDGTVKESGDNPCDDPQVNVKSFTSIGAVYGGGYGAGAVMVGNPHVSINESVGDPDFYPTTGDFDGTGFKEKTLTVDGHDVILPSHTKGKIGAINNVFGGGNAAKVIGDTHVNIGTLIGEDVYMEVAVKAGTDLTNKGFYTHSAGTYTSVTAGTAVEGTVYYKKYPVVGVDVRGNVYGGGNAAEVTGNTNVNIGKKKTE